MPYPIEDRPIPPGGHPGPLPIEMVDIEGEKFPVSTVKKILEWGQRKRFLMIIPQDQGCVTQFGWSCLDMMEAGTKQDLAKGAVAFKDGLGNYLEMFKVYKMPDADLTGLPARAGAPEAMETAAWLVQKYPTAQGLIQTDPQWLAQRAARCRFLFAMSETLFDGEKHVSVAAAPLSKDGVKVTRTVAVVMKPQVEASLLLSTQAEAMYKYLNEPYVKAAQTRRDHERRDGRSDQRAEERIGAVARTEAREEADARMHDALKALTGEKKDK